MKTSIKILVMFLIWISTSVSSFSQTTSPPEEIKVIKDSTGVTFFLFDSTQVTYLIEGLKEVGWNKKQIASLEKQVANVKWKSYKQSQLIDSLENQVETYISISFNYKNQVEVKQQKIEELEKNIEDLETINDNLSTIKEEYEKKIKKLKKRVLTLICTNTITIILLILSVSSGG